MNLRTMNTREETSERGPSQNSNSSTDVNDIDNYILCEKCGYWDSRPMYQHTCGNTKRLGT